MDFEQLVRSIDDVLGGLDEDHVSRIRDAYMEKYDDLKIGGDEGVNFVMNWRYIGVSALAIVVALIFLH